MSKLNTTIISLAVVFAITTTGAMAATYTKMREDNRLHSELLAASMAYIITERCLNMRLRKFRIFNKAYSLRKHAQSLGYTNSEVVAYVESKAEQERFRTIATSKLEELGAVKDNDTSFCTVGRAEIDKGSLAGSFLYGR